MSPGDPTASELLRGMMTEHHLPSGDSPRVVAGLLRALQRDPGARAHAGHGASSASMRVSARAAAARNGRGEFKQLDIRFATFAILGMANWSYQWFRPGGSATAEQVARRSGPC